MSRPSNIPDRWLDYTPVGKQIEGTRFICFKCPLRPAVNENVEEKDRLDYKKLLSTIPNLGIIIDLTDTFRYYDPQVFESNGLSYMKIRIPGQCIPPKDLVEVFKNHVGEYLRKNPNNDKLIGVHCTHGVNRTGYLICCYLISVMGFSAEEAVKKFETARGHKIERERYIRALRDFEIIYKNEGPRHRTERDRWVNDYEDRWNGASSRGSAHKFKERSRSYNQQAHNRSAPYHVAKRMFQPSSNSNKHSNSNTYRYVREHKR